MSVAGTSPVVIAALAVSEPVAGVGAADTTLTGGAVPDAVTVLMSHANKVADKQRKARAMAERRNGAKQ